MRIAAPPEPEPDIDTTDISCPPLHGREQIEARFGGVFIEAPGGLSSGRACARTRSCARR